jgi:signal transduction histidine kinase
MRALIICAIICSWCASIFGQSSDSLIANYKIQLVNAKTDSQKLNCFTQLSWEYGVVDIDTALMYANDELNLAKRINSPYWISMGYNDLSIVAMRKGNYYEAIPYLKESLRIRIQLKDSNLLASTYSKISNCYVQLGENEQALQYLFSALKIYEALNDKGSQATLLGGLGLVFLSLKDYTKAEYYFVNSAKLHAGLGDDYMYWLMQINLVNLYSEKRDFAKALTLGGKIEKVFSKFEDPSTSATLYGNMGYIYRQIKNNESGLSYYLKAKALAVSINDSAGIATYSQNIGNTYLDMNRVNSAYPFIMEALNVSSKFGLLEEEKNARYSLAKYYILKGESELAIDELDFFVSISDTIAKCKSVEATQEMETRYSTELKQNKINALSAENKVKQLEIENKNASLSIARRNNILLFLVLLASGAFAFIVVSKQKVTSQLRLSTALAEEQRRGIASVISAQEEERRQIARDLHDSIGQQLAALKLSIKEENTKSADLLNSTIHDVRQISHQMMPVTLERQGLAIALEELVTNAKNDIVKINFESFNLPSEISPQVQLTLFRAAQEIISNTLKHSKASLLNIQLYLSGRKLILFAEDNGIGLSDSRKEGMGLLNIKTRVNALEGEFRLDNRAEGGCAITIIVPCV